MMDKAPFPDPATEQDYQKERAEVWAEEGRDLTRAEYLDWVRLDEAERGQDEMIEYLARRSPEDVLEELVDEYCDR